MSGSEDFLARWLRLKSESERALPAADVMPKAREIALKLANGPRWAIRYTKTALNKALRQQLNLTMDTALASEWLCSWQGISTRHSRSSRG